jgi:multicomponent Na+:H+ antiporter subunit G
VTQGAFFDIAGAVLILGGSFLTLAAGVGVLRFPDLLARLHAAAKPQMLGVLLAVAGLALRLRTTSAVVTLALIALFQLLTAPVAAHLLARAGYRTGRIDPGYLVVDELTADLEAALDGTDPGGGGQPPVGSD